MPRTGTQLKLRIESSATSPPQCTRGRELKSTKVLG